VPRFLVLPFPAVRFVAARRILFLMPAIGHLFTCLWTTKAACRLPAGIGDRG